MQQRCRIISGNRMVWQLPLNSGEWRAVQESNRSSLRAQWKWSGLRDLFSDERARLFEMKTKELENKSDRLTVMTQ